MEYNTARTKLAIPEYGRNIQKMIQHVIGIEDRRERTAAAHRIVEIMANMHPQVKEESDYQHKLWDHLYFISDFQLDVDSPFPPPEKETIHRKPERLHYSENHIRFKHYGKHLEKMIKYAAALEDGPEKNELALMIANQMKRSYLNWNRDSVSDKMILKQLHELSDGKLNLGEDVQLIGTGEILAGNRSNKKKKNTQNKGNNNGRKKKYGRKTY
jgi:RNase H-fold protein (predicted Holliday junction resolvase)